jgi:hypothetical protein
MVARSEEFIGIKGNFSGLEAAYIKGNDTCRRSADQF